MYFSRQSPEDLINMRREALQAVALKKTGAAVMTETVRRRLLQPGLQRLQGRLANVVLDYLHHIYRSQRPLSFRSHQSI